MSKDTDYTLLNRNFFLRIPDDLEEEVLIDSEEEIDSELSDDSNEEAQEKKMKIENIPRNKRVIYSDKAGKLTAKEVAVEKEYML